VSLKENIDGSQDGSGYECEFSPREQKKIIHRIDRRLVVTVGVLYCISLMDRTNLSAAAIAGFVGNTSKSAQAILTESSMRDELKLNQLEGSISHYSIVTIVFFASYIVFQPPATVICRYLGPRNFLAAIVLLWGAVMIGMGFSDSYGTLAALRVVLGILEAGFFPSCVYLLSTWCTCAATSVVIEDADSSCRHALRCRQAVLGLLHPR
jgi:MFS family permease